MSVGYAVTVLVASDQSIFFGSSWNGRADFGLAIIFLWLFFLLLFFLRLFFLRLFFLRFFRFLFQILHDHGNATIGCVEWCSGRAQHLIGIASHLRNLVGLQPVVLHQPAGSVGAVGGQFPIAIFAASRVGFGIGVAFNREMVRELAEFDRQ